MVSSFRWQLTAIILLCSAAGLLLAAFFSRHLPAPAAYLLAAAIVAALAVTLGPLLARRLTRPLERICEFAWSMASGRLGARLTDEGNDESLEASRALNKMAQWLAAELGELGEERSRLERILADMVEGVLVLDRDGRIQLLNRAMERMLRAEARVVVGRPLIEVWRPHKLNEMVGRILGSGEGLAEEISVSMPQERIFRVQASVVHKGDLVVVLVFHDITELKRLERIRRDFVANVSHELKTPLTSIKGYLEALLDGAKDDPERSTQFLEIAKRHTDNLDAIISDLLVLSLIESGRYRWKRHTVRIPELVKRSVELIQPAADKKRQTIETAMDEAVPAITGDSDKLAEAVMNLLDNAVKYTPEGGRITVAAAMTPQGLELSVADTGMGIPPQERDRIFERFYRIDRARTRELGGTGLGLAIVKHIIEAHHGAIAVSSEPNRGTRFTITLPAPPALTSP